MPFVHRLRKGVRDTGLEPDRSGLRDAEPHRNRVGGLEADAPDVAGEPVRVRRHHLDGVGPVGLEDPHRQRRPDAVAVQEDHDLADHLLLGPCRRDPLGPHGPDAGDLPQPLRGRPDHVEDGVAEGSHQLLGIDRTDAPDEPGAEVLADTVVRGRLGRPQEPRPELRAVRPVVHPLAGRGDPLAGRDCRRVADHRHQPGLAARLHAQNGEAVVGVVEGDALDEPRHHLALRRRARRRDAVSGGARHVLSRPGFVTLPGIRRGSRQTSAVIIL